MAKGLIDFLAETSGDPVAHVYGSFPWGEAGTELADQKGPEPWQLEILRMIRDGIVTPEAAIRIAVSSGHGIGKTALVAWIMLWAIMTREDTKGVVTANTENQLKTKTWAELAKWFRLHIARELFLMTATGLFSRDPEHEKTWRIDAIPWSEANPTAFAGLHNKHKRIIVIFDEASRIVDPIWETVEGAMTDSETEIIWCAFGNPTENTGRFRECFAGGRFSHRWATRQIDARRVGLGNQKLFAEWIADYGEDDDFVRVRVKGEFPRLGILQFISSELVDGAMTREAPDVLATDACIMGVDVGRYGDDPSVICIRKGRDGRSIPPEVHRGRDTMFMASRVSELYYEYHPDAIFIDEGGIGAGVVDRCLQLGISVIGVQFGARADRLGPESQVEKYANKRAEMYGHMRYWLRGGALPKDEQLRQELIGPQYTFNAQDAIQLERKADMKGRGLSSPDRADALALTFAFPVVAKPVYGPKGPRSHVSEYDPLEIAA